ncbi:hypothetical protein [Microbispora sp. NPDC049633]|uniref:hypothetical protein n=1 Tax=Microbispora sp. NPDC049633 TaxID=3154355 RepID=UPI00341319E1
MGFHLYREVKLYAPDELTFRELWVAGVLADDANDDTRMTWTSAYDPEIMRTARVKNDRDMRKILAKLKEAGVIEQVAAGHNGSVAKFRFLPLGAVVENPVENPAEGGTDQTPYADGTNPQGVRFEPPSGAEGGSNWTGRRFDLDLPTPHSPQKNSSSSSSAAPTHGEEDEMIPEEKTQTPVADFVTEAAARHIVDRQIGIDRDQARAVVALLGREAASRGKPVGAWHRYIARFSDDQLRDALGRLQASQRPAQPAAEESARCGQCNPSRRLEDAEGRDMGPCPTCHPSARKQAQVS